MKKKKFAPLSFLWLIMSDNILRDRLGPEKFEKAVEFYDANQKLTPEDRVQIRDDLKLVLVGDNLASYGSGLIGFLMPTIYMRFFKKGLVNAKSFFQKPLLSGAIGVANMMVTHRIYSKKLFDEKVSLGLPERQLNVWKAMEQRLLGVYMFYYAKTAQDPKFKLEDPREYTEENRLKVRFDPEKYKEGHPHDELSTWDRIRLSNGYDITEEKSAWDEIRSK